MENIKPSLRAVAKQSNIPSSLRAIAKQSINPSSLRAIAKQSLNPSSLRALAKQSIKMKQEINKQIASGGKPLAMTVNIDEKQLSLNYVQRRIHLLTYK